MSFRGRSGPFWRLKDDSVVNPAKFGPVGVQITSDSRADVTKDVTGHLGRHRASQVSRMRDRTEKIRVARCSWSDFPC